MSWRPALREGLYHVAETDQAPAALFDPVVNRRVDLGPLSAAMVPLLDGSRTVDELVDEVLRARPDTGRGTVEHTLRALLLMNLLEGAGTRILEQVRRVVQGGVNEPVVLEGSRFACQGSGECCQNYAFGPLRIEDVETLERLDEEGALTALAGGPWLNLAPDESGEMEPYLVTRDERCVFLAADGRCGVHAAFGADAKPALCRLYPLHHLPTIDGLKVFDSGECATFPVSARSGSPLASELSRITKLLPERLSLYHPILFAAPATPCDYGHFLRLQRFACEVAGTEPLGVVLELLEAFSTGLAGCPLAPGEPEATLDALFARAPESFRRPAEAGFDVEARRELGRLFDALLAVVMRSVLDAHPKVTGHGLTERLLRQFAEVCQLVQSLAAHTASPSEHDLPDYFREVAATTLEGEEIEAARSLALRHALFGDRLLVFLHLGFGSLRLAVAHLVTTIGAKLHATTRRSKVAGLADLGFGNQLAQRVLRLDGAARVLTQFEESVWPVARDAVALAAWRP